MDKSDLYDALVQAYTKDLENYKEILKTYKNMLEQKEKELQDLRIKAISILQAPVVSKVKVENTVSSGKTRKSKATAQKNTRKGKLSLKDLAVGKMSPESDTQQEKRGKNDSSKNEIKCLYHPESPAVDKGRRLCKSCKWKLVFNGLLNFDKDPAVVSFLKGKTSDVPKLGQPLCPVHPDVPAFNKKTGLCHKCQIKAKAIGVADRQLTEEELGLLMNI